MATDRTTPNPYRRSLLRQERSVSTRRAIVRAAARLWADHGYDETTVEEICAAAGVGRSTYYLHFDSKERLLIELSIATAGGVASDVDAAPRTGTIDDQLRTFVEGLVRRMESVPRSLAALVMRRVSAATVTPRDSGVGPIVFDDVLAAIVHDAKLRGEVRAECDAREVGEILGGMTLDALQRWAGGTSDRGLDQILWTRFDLVLAAVRAPEQTSVSSTGSTLS